MLLNNYCVTGYRDVNDFSMYTFIYLSTCESERARKNCSDIVFPSAGPLAEYLRLGRMRPGGSWTSGTQPRSLTSDRDPTNRATTCISQSQALQYGMQASQVCPTLTGLCNLCMNTTSLTIPGNLIHANVIVSNLYTMDVYPSNELI